ncbi:hypothetical protein AB205_0116180 [Aquarana catesbeiana]|uniref:Uncharacterized protein n=1 Tax=Aquarana catesbeiana TaxID=8400 RepID=A0A2G9SH65_AQUCT|nr:hypothetical protein AB205_0116180 [Aquarana catesbeiana]
MVGYLPVLECSDVGCQVLLPPLPVREPGSEALGRHTRSLLLFCEAPAALSYWPSSRGRRTELSAGIMRHSRDSQKWGQDTKCGTGGGKETNERKFRFWVERSQLKQCSGEYSKCCHLFDI